MNIKKTLKALEPLANKLGTKVDELFGYYVKEVILYRIYFWVYTFIGIILTGVGTILLNDVYPFVEYSPTTMEYIESSVGIFLMVLGMITFVLQLFRIPNLIRAFKNPEYEAMEDLLGTLLNKD